jgi:hypothetical protein
VFNEGPKSSKTLGRLMIWFLLLFSLPAFAQVDLSAIRKLDEELPTYNEYKVVDEELDIKRQNRQHRPPFRVIPYSEIEKSGTHYGAVRAGAYIINIAQDKAYKVSKPMYVKTFKLEDEDGYKYFQDKDGKVAWKITGSSVEPIKEEISLYVPPLRYTPAPEIARSEYDKKLSIPPEVSFYGGIVQGAYMKDLFNDKKAYSGLSNQYGLHLFTNWKLPIKAGLVLHYEKSSYKLASGGQVIYSSPSIGPQFKTREFEIAGQPIRFQTQFRISPLAKASAETVNGNVDLKFNSADLLASIERPIKNRYGEFVLGLYAQSQWLSLKDQPAGLSLNASNATNKSYGISFAQVFE